METKQEARKLAERMSNQYEQLMLAGLEEAARALEDVIWYLIKLSTPTRQND